VKVKFLDVIAASALLIVVSAPVQALTLRSSGTLNEAFNNALNGPDIYNLDAELTKILSLENHDSIGCRKKCSNGQSTEGSHGGGPGGGGGGSLASGQSLATALLGLGGGGGGSGRHTDSGRHIDNDANFGDDFNAGANSRLDHGERFDHGERNNVSAAPLPGALPLFASGLGAIGLIGWWRKRRARAA
jgi:hypothetical protein